MTDFSIEGEVIHVSETKSLSEGKLMIKTLVVELDMGRYTTQPPIQFINAAIQKLDGIEVGDRVLVGFKIGGRKKKDADYWFPSIEGTFIERL